MIQIDREKCVNCGQCTRACPLSIFRMEDGVVTVGRQRRCFLCMHCAAACPQKAIYVEGETLEETYPPRMTDPLVQLVQTRRSTRHFGATLPPRETLEAALHHAAWAPAAKNDHHYAFTVVYGKEQTDYLCKLTVDYGCESQEAPELMSMGKLGQNWVTCEAPCVILGHEPPDSPLPVVNTAIATTTLELLLWREKISTCWGGYLMQAAQCSAAVRAWLGIPEGNRVCSALMVGYAQGEHYANIPRRDAPESHWITADGGK